MKVRPLPAVCVHYPHVPFLTLTNPDEWINQPRLSSENGNYASHKAPFFVFVFFLIFAVPWNASWKYEKKKKKHLEFPFMFEASLSSQLQNIETLQEYSQEYILYKKKNKTLT